MEISKINTIIEKAQGLLENKKFYEYEQKIKTLSNRFIATQKYSEAIDLLLKAANNLLSHNESNAGFELANNLLLISEQNKIQLSDEIKDKLTEFLIISKFDKQKLRFCNNLLNRLYPNGNVKICEIIGLELLEQKIYFLAQKYLVHCGNLEADVKLLSEWKKNGKPTESDLFIARYILMKLCAQKTNESSILLNTYSSEFQIKPLWNFLKFLIQAVEMKSKQAFKKIIDGYDKAYNLDPSFSKFLQKIGVIHFGLLENNSNSVGSLIKFLFE